MRTVNRIPTSLRRVLRTTARSSETRASQAEKQQGSPISMGKPITTPCLIPVLHSSTPSCINNPFMVNGEPYGVTALSFGTAHGAVVVEDVDNVNVPLLGAAIGTHALFPKGASVVFLQVVDGENVKARLWHREFGETAFTPEAACVAGTTAMMLQKVLFSEVTVHMRGYTSKIGWDRGNDEVSLTMGA